MHVKELQIYLKGKNIILGFELMNLFISEFLLNFYLKHIFLKIPTSQKGDEKLRKLFEELGM